MKKLILSLVVLLTMATSAFAQIGSLSADLVYTPLTPCRIVDTRFAAAGKIATGETRIFKSWAASFATQGGNGNDCGIPQSTNVAALALNLLVIIPSGEGFLKAYPGGAAVPNASTLNYKPNDVLANSAILKVSQTNGDWNLYSVSATDFAADVVGYYAKPVATALTCTTTTAVSSAINSGPANGVYYGFVIPAACPTGTTEVSMRCSTDNAIATASIYDATGNLSNPQCEGQSPSNLYLVRANRVCCNIPGR
jgi:hypothetical protein